MIIFLKDLESKMFEFLRDSKIHKIKKDTVFQDYEYGEGGGGENDRLQVYNCTSIHMGQKNTAFK